MTPTNETTAAAAPSPPAAATGAPRPPGTWSPAQLARLETEWHNLRRAFAFHPVVTVIPLAGSPPTEFQLDYKLRTLAMDAAGQLVFVDHCGVHLWLPPQFPLAAPVVRPTGKVFHPNVDDEGIHLAPPWNPASGTLADVVARCGHMLAFQIYDPSNVQNVPALQWVMKYAHLVPTDPDMVLRADGGGEIGRRIAQAGAQMLERFRAELTEASQGVLDGGPGTDRQAVRELGGRVSTELEVFAEPDVPEHLRTAAAELSAWAQSMTPRPSIWDDLRSLLRHARDASGAGEGVRRARKTLAGALRELDALVDREPAADPLETVARLPVVSALDTAAVRLRRGVREADQVVPALRAALEEVSGPPLKAVGSPGGLLHAQTSIAVARASGEAAAAREAATALLAEIEPLLDRARLELAAVDGLVTWAALTDLVRRGNELVQRLIALGAATVQACYLQGPGGTFALHAFEERVDLGGAAVVVRRVGPGALEVFDARSMALLGKGPSPLRVKVAGKDGTPREAEVRATQHVEEVQVQLEYVARVSRELVAGLGNFGPGTKAPSWAGRFASALSGYEATHAAAEAHRRASHRWAPLLADLEELSGFKERLATSRLLDRHVEFVRALLAARDKSQASLAEANERLAFIGSRSTRDTVAGVVLVPPQLAPENVERLKQRERAERDLAKVRKLLAQVTTEVQSRIGSERLIGKSGVPRLRVLKLAEDAEATLGPLLSNEHVRARVLELEHLLGTRLRPTASADAKVTTAPQQQGAASTSSIS